MILAIQETVSAFEIGGAFAVVMASMKLVEFTIARTTNGGGKGFTEKDRTKLYRIADDANVIKVWHEPDARGVQGWKNFGAEETREAYQTMIDLQRETLAVLERIAEKQ